MSSSMSSRGAVDGYYPVPEQSMSPHSRSQTSLSREERRKLKKERQRRKIKAMSKKDLYDQMSGEQAKRQMGKGRFCCSSLLKDGKGEKRKELKVKKKKKRIKRIKSDSDGSSSFSSCFPGDRSNAKNEKKKRKRRRERREAANEEETAKINAKNESL